METKAQPTIMYCQPPRSNFHLAGRINRDHVGCIGEGEAFAFVNGQSLQRCVKFPVAALLAKTRSPESGWFFHSSSFWDLTAHWRRITCNANVPLTNSAWTCPGGTKRQVPLDRRPDSDHSIWLVALENEQGTLVTDGDPHVISFGCCSETVLKIQAGCFQAVS